MNKLALIIFLSMSPIALISGSYFTDDEITDYFSKYNYFPFSYDLDFAWDLLIASDSEDVLDLKASLRSAGRGDHEMPRPSVIEKSNRVLEPIVSDLRQRLTEPRAIKDNRFSYFLLGLSIHKRRDLIEEYLSQWRVESMIERLLAQGIIDADGDEIGNYYERPHIALIISEDQGLRNNKLVVEASCLSFGDIDNSFKPFHFFDDLREESSFFDRHPELKKVMGLFMASNFLIQPFVPALSTAMSKTAKKLDREELLKKLRDPAVSMIDEIFADLKEIDRPVNANYRVFRSDSHGLFIKQLRGPNEKLVRLCEILNGRGLIAEHYGVFEVGGVHYLLTELIPGRTICPSGDFSSTAIDRDFDFEGYSINFAKKLAVSLLEIRDLNVCVYDLHCGNVFENSDGKIVFIDLDRWTPDCIDDDRPNLNLREFYATLDVVRRLHEQRLEELGDGVYRCNAEHFKMSEDGSDFFKALYQLFRTMLYAYDKVSSEEAEGMFDNFCRDGAGVAKHLES